MTDRLSDRLVSPPTRASARKRANAADETRRETPSAVAHGSPGRLGGGDAQQ
jgi:hypothetical protein